MSEIYFSLKCDNYRDLILAPMPMQCFIHVKLISRKNSVLTHLDISVFCTSKEYDNVTTPIYPFFALLSVKCSLTGG